MTNPTESEKIASLATQILKKEISVLKINRLGNDYTVATINDGVQDLIVKTGPGIEAEYLALSTLATINFPSPRIVGYIEGATIMTKLDGIEIRDLSASNRFRIIPEVFDAVEKLRACKSPIQSGNILDVSKGKRIAWKDYLNQVVNSAASELPGNSNDIDESLILNTIQLITKGLEELPGDIQLTLLHNDVNLTNCILDKDCLLGVIDWGDAIYGDWLYDMARLRMNLEQLSDVASLGLYKEKIKEVESREQLYYVCRLLEYLAIYKRYGKDYGVTNNQTLLSQVLSR